MAEHGRKAEGAAVPVSAVAPRQRESYGFTPDVQQLLAFFATTLPFR